MSADIDEQAARWHLAQADDAMDWAAFTDWLEADPRHREAFDAIALLDERIDAAQPTLHRLLGEEPAPARRRIPRVAALAGVAAALVGMIALGVTQFATKPAHQIVAYTAPGGKSRDVQLADGSVATLAPGSTLKVADGRAAPMLLDGRAYFDVRQNAAQPLTVQVGTYEIRDIGTRFDVSSAAGTVRVAVAEGRVAIKAAGTTVEICVLGGPIASRRRPSARPCARARSQRKVSSNSRTKGRVRRRPFRGARHLGTQIRELDLRRAATRIYDGNSVGVGIIWSCLSAARSAQSRTVSCGGRAVALLVEGTGAQNHRQSRTRPFEGWRS